QTCALPIYARNDLGQLFDQLVLGTGAVRVPDQVMRLIHDQQIPAGGKGGVLSTLVFLQPLQRDQRQLGVLEGVAGIALDKALVVEQGDFQVEAAAHFHQPLMLEVFRYQNQYAASTAGEQLAVNYQASFDGLAQADFIGQQYTRGDTVSDF